MDTVTDAAGAGASPSRDGDAPADGRQQAKDRPDDGSTGSSEASSADDAQTSEGDGAGDLGDEDRAWRSREIRDVLAQGLGTYGAHVSAVVITGDSPTIGSIAGRDGRVGGDGSGVVVSRVAQRILDDVYRLHVAPPGFDLLVERAGSGSLTLVRVPRRFGRTTAGYRLLCGGRPVHELRTDRPLGLLPVEELPGGAGLLLDGLTVSQAAELRAADLAGLAERLTARECTMIVLVDPETRLADPAVVREVCPLDQPPAARDLVARRLADELGSTEHATAVLAAGELASLLDHAGPDQFDVHRLVGLALDLAEGARGGRPVDETLRRFHDGSRQTVEQWVDDIVDHQSQLALALSLSVLHDMPYDAVSRAAIGLERTLHEHLKRRRPESYIDKLGGDDAPVRQPRRARLRAAAAKLTTETRSTRYGAAELEIAAFLSGDYPANVLDYVWREYDLERPALLDWLRSVADDVEESVRIRAATAIGFLACQAFDPIRRVIVAPWAASGNRDERERAVAALALPARHPATGARVLALVDEWCDKPGQSLRMAAARALGASVGEVLAGGPDERLGKLAERAGWGLSLAVGQSIAELVANAEPDRRQQLLDLLDGWAGDPARRRQRAAVCGFLDAASNVWTLQGDDDENVWWPSLLWWSRSAPADQVIARLWAAALREPGMDDAVHRVLGSWAAVAERTPPMRGALVELLAKTATTERLARLLMHHAKTWRDHKPPAASTAKRLLDLLTRRDT